MKSCTASARPLQLRATAKVHHTQKNNTIISYRCTSTIVILHLLSSSSRTFRRQSSTTTVSCRRQFSSARYRFDAANFVVSNLPVDTTQTSRRFVAEPLPASKSTPLLKHCKSQLSVRLKERWERKPTLSFWKKSSNRCPVIYKHPWQQQQPRRKDPSATTVLLSWTGSWQDAKRCYNNCDPNVGGTQSSRSVYSCTRYS